MIILYSFFLKPQPDRIFQDLIGEQKDTALSSMVPMWPFTNDHKLTDFCTEDVLFETVLSCWKYLQIIDGLSKMFFSTYKVFNDI